jgi:predicted nucleic acid-binding protein
MKIIADTNTFLCVALGEPERESIIASTQSSALFAPEILPYEIANAISKMARRKLITPKQAQDTLNYSLQIPVSLKSVAIDKSLKIASEYGIYAYDAFFLQAAIENQAPIISLDKQLLKTASKLNIETVSI